MRDPLQQLVANRVPQRIVDALEMIEVRYSTAIGRRAERCKLLFELFAKQRAIGKVGQRIVMGEVSNLALVDLPVGHIVDDPKGRIGPDLFFICVMVRRLEKDGAVFPGREGENFTFIEQRLTGLLAVRHPLCRSSWPRCSGNACSAVFPNHGARRETPHMCSQARLTRT